MPGAPIFVNCTAQIVDLDPKIFVDIDPSKRSVSQTGDLAALLSPSVRLEGKLRSTNLTRGRECLRLGRDLSV